MFVFWVFAQLSSWSSSAFDGFDPSSVLDCGGVCDAPPFASLLSLTVAAAKLTICRSNGGFQGDRTPPTGAAFIQHASFSPARAISTSFAVAIIIITIIIRTKRGLGDFFSPFFVFCILASACLSPCEEHLIIYLFYERRRTRHRRLRQLCLPTDHNSTVFPSDLEPFIQPLTAGVCLFESQRILTPLL